MKKKKGLPYITIIEKLMNGDEEICNLYKFVEFKKPFNEHVETTDFKYESEVLTRPDVVSFDYGVKWRKDYIPFYKFYHPNWEKEFCEYDTLVVLGSELFENFCENIEFTYNEGRVRCKMDDVFDDNCRYVKKIDVVDRRIYIEPDNHYASFEFVNVMLHETQREDNGKQIDKLIYDWFRINLERYGK